MSFVFSSLRTAQAQRLRTEDIKPPSTSSNDATPTISKCADNVGSGPVTAVGSDEDSDDETADDEESGVCGDVDTDNMTNDELDKKIETITKVRHDWRVRLTENFH